MRRGFVLAPVPTLFSHVARVLLLLGVVLLPRLAGAAEDLRFALVMHETRTRLCPGEVRRVHLALRNAGRTPWSPAREDRVAYHWLDARGEPVVFEGRRTELPHEVLPGETIEVDAVLEAPLVPGTYRLQWAMVREHVTWFPGEPVPVSVDVLGAGPPLAWSIEDADALGSLPAGEGIDLEVTLRNTGCATWSAEHGDALSYHWWGSDGLPVVWDGVRTPLPRVGPGERATVHARVEAPPRMGRYRLQWEPLREDVAWYGVPTGGDRDLDVTVDRAALAWSLTRGGQPPRLHAKQMVTIEVGLRNEGLLPWSAEAGDRLSYRWERLDAPGEPSEGLRSVLASAVAPGESLVVGARLQAPPVPGHYRLTWEPVREYIEWYGAPVEGGAADFEVEVAEPLLAFGIEKIEAPGIVWASRTGTLGVVLRNTGAEPWSPEAGDRLSYRWLDPDGRVVAADGLRTELPRDVAPGETVELDMRLRGPEDPGRFVLSLEMVREHVQWFGPPTGGKSDHHVRVVRGSAALGSGLVVLVVLVVLVWRRGLGPARARAIAGAIVLPLGVMASVFVSCETFFDLSGIDAWSGARWLSLSGAALWGLALVVLPRRVWPWAAGVLGTALLVLALADLAYVQFFGSIVPLGALMSAHQLGDAAGTVSSLMQPAYSWLVAPWAALVALAAWGPRPTRTMGQLVPARTRPALSLALFALALPSVVSLGAATLGGLGTKVFSEARNVGRLGLANAHLFQLGRVLRSFGGPAALDEVERREVAAYYARRPRTETGRSFGAARGMNVVVLQVEALQDWVVDAQLQGHPVMPFLASATDEALRFDHVFDQTAQGRTSDAEYLVLASGHPLAEGALCFLREGADFYTSVHALRDEGYATLSAHPYKRGFWNRAALHPRYGFSTSVFRRELGEGPVVGWGLADGPFLERMAARLEKLPQPFASFLITLSLHHPYASFPPGLQTLELGDLQGSPLGNYLHAMHYFDRSLQAFFEDLRARGLLEQMVVLVYGDHVTQLPDTPALLELAGVRSWDPAVPTRLHRVPAFLWVPGTELRGHSDRVGGQIDLGATVLHLLGVSPPAAFVGRPLVEPGVGFAALPDGSAIADDRMFVASGRDIGGEGACFDFPTGGSRPLEDCRDLARQAEQELAISRRVLDHDLFRALPEL